MPDTEATRKLAEAANRLADGREDITEALHGVTAATKELSRQVATDREEYDRRLTEASARTEQVAEESAPRTEVKAQVRGTRRRLAAVVALVLVVALTGFVLVSRSRDKAATRAQFDQLAKERVANCHVSQVQKTAEVDFVRGELLADQASLALLTGPSASDNARAFAHVVFDGRIAAEQVFLLKYPAAPLTCTVPTR
ncbi:hypothetical protein [Frankia sp. AgW1.1]|uniref:hypothetical protein n=1 Tax=Frankia sp. AgW1.1 TaxID=1836971 RepID=UPI0019342193|nr:hypothetical protein [Frankia sp. AgW1.1]MBL7487072.1 hypothetical protein [Frankia sp. AgW1.1]